MYLLKHISVWSCYKALTSEYFARSQRAKWPR